MMAPAKVGAIADSSLKKLIFLSSLLLVPCTKSYKPSFTAYLKELKRHVDDNFSVKCFIFHSFKYCKQCTVASDVYKYLFLL